jgi:hypothetical protein
MTDRIILTVGEIVVYDSRKAVATAPVLNTTDEYITVSDPTVENEYFIYTKDYFGDNVYKKVILEKILEDNRYNVSKTDIYGKDKTFEDVSQLYKPNPGYARAPARAPTPAPAANEPKYKKVSDNTEPGKTYYVFENKIYKEVILLKTKGVFGGYQYTFRYPNDSNMMERETYTLYEKIQNGGGKKRKTPKRHQKRRTQRRNRK